MRVGFAKSVCSSRVAVAMAARWIMAAAIVVNAVQVAHAEDATAISLEDGCRKLARRVAEIIDSEGRDKTVAVGTFSGVPRLESSGGVGLAQRARAALEAEGLTVTRRAACQLSGEFSDGMELFEPLSTRMVTLRVEYKVRDTEDRVLAQGVVSMFGDAPLEIAGGTFEFRKPESREAAEADNRRLAASFREPSAAVNDNLTRPAAGSPFGLGVIVTRGSVSGPKRPQVRDGRAFVQLDRGDEYAVTLRNDSAAEVLVSLTIDGLDVFLFSKEPEDRGRKVHFVLAAGSEYRVPGWYVTRKKSLAFKTTGYADSEAAKLFGDSESIGQITATFYESRTKAPYASLREPLGTTKGSEVATNYQSVERDEGPELAVITVRYEKAP